MRLKIFPDPSDDFEKEAWGMAGGREEPDEDRVIPWVFLGGGAG